MKRLLEAAKKECQAKKRIKKEPDTTPDGTPIEDGRQPKLEEGREKYVIHTTIKIPSAKMFFEVDMLKIQLNPQNLSIPNFNIAISVGDNFISDSFYFANTKKLKTACAKKTGFFISKEEILENNEKEQDFFNIFFLKKEESSLITLSEGWYDQTVTMTEIMKNINHSINLPCPKLVMHLYYYSGDELNLDVKKFMLLLQLVNFDVASHIFLSYIVPFLSKECAYGIRRKEDCVNFDMVKNDYIVSKKWDGQPKGFQEMIFGLLMGLFDNLDKDAFLFD